MIKVERPEGDFARDYDTAVAGQSAYFVWLNAGKQSLVLDLRLADDLARLRALVGRADVLIQNLKPGALAKLGLDLNEVHAAQPALISMSISGFHPAGPGAQRKAYDLLMQAESGLADITGSPESPGRVGVSVVDLSTGMFAYEAILEALLVRAQTGRGERLHVALFDAIAEWMAVPYLLERYGGAAPARIGLAHPGICPYGVFESADGVRFVLSIQNEREWQRLCEVGLSAPELLADARCVDNETRVANRDYVDGEVAQRFLARSYVELHEDLDAADLAFAPLNIVAELKNHPDFHTTGIEVGGERVELPVVPGRGRPSDLAVPALGEHTDAIISWLDS